ncbi:DUF481 domain-containing protein [Chitinophaga sp. Hz27]|uniref:DUF481 domain-containing protein n=1 Tax=Chitinophaga sp. Hz27 TaxID=3347169 RepID=UPI0035D9FF32
MALVKYIHAGLFAAAILFSWKTAAQQLTPGISDEIQLFNGDHLTGKVKQIQRGELTFDPDKLNDNAVIKLRDIDYIVARRKQYLIEDVNNIRHVGILSKGKAPGWVKIIREHDTIDLFIQDLDHIENLDKKFWTRLDGNASLGYSYSRSSNIGRINESHTATYSTRRWLFQTNGDLMYTMDSEFKGIEKADMGLNAYIEFWKKFFAVSTLQFQRSTELGLNARYQAAQGAGPIILKNRKHDLRMATGISVQKEYSTDSVNNGRSVSTEIPLYVNYYLYKLGKPELKLQCTNAIFYGISDQGRWRIDQNVILYWKIISHLTANVQVYFDFDSRPPNVDAQKVDYGTVFSIGYSW